VALGTPLKGIPRPWKYFKVPALMVNAYEMIKSEKLRDDVRKSGGLHNFLDFDGIIFLDSGGFQAMAHEITIHLKWLVKIYKMAKADYYFSLDYPSMTARNSKRKIELTVTNYEELKREVKEVIPIVHPNLSRALIEYKAYQKHDPNYIAIGGLVPLMLTSRGISKGRKQAIDLIAEIKKRHSGSLHIMGLGAPTVVPILTTLGCSSTDSAAWRIKAAHGKIMLPNSGERYVSSRGAKFNAHPLSEEEKNAIERLQCSVLEEHGWQGLQESFQIRALFNAWITLHASCMQNKLNGPFSRLQKYAEEKTRLEVCSFH
jgi:queuine/archaeosine tRNA-ribosyltransferase